MAFDASKVLPLLDPVTIERRGGFARIETADGSADVHGLDGTDALMVSHAAGAAIWDLLIELARVGRFTIMPIGCPTFVTDEANQSDLPAGLPGPIEVIQTGSDLMSAIDNS